MIFSHPDVLAAVWETAAGCTEARAGKGHLLYWSFSLNREPNP